MFCVSLTVFLKIFCGLFSICVGLVIVCCFGIYRAGLNEKGIAVAIDTTSVEAEKVVYTALSKLMKNHVTILEIKNEIRHSIKEFVFARTQRDPVVIPVILSKKD